MFRQLQKAIELSEREAIKRKTKEREEAKVVEEYSKAYNVLVFIIGQLIYWICFQSRLQLYSQVMMHSCYNNEHYMNSSK